MLACTRPQHLAAYSGVSAQVVTLRARVGQAVHVQQQQCFAVSRLLWRSSHPTRTGQHATGSIPNAYSARCSARLKRQRTCLSLLKILPESFSKHK